MKSWLLIGDPHAHPEYDNDRFEWLGKCIVDSQPDRILCIGDFADMPSLSSYDKGKKSFEGRRYRRDIESVIDAQEKMFAPLHKYNEARRRNKERLYRPEFYMTIGNHEHRINRVTEDSSELEDVISVKDLMYEEYGWHCTPFMEVLNLDGWSFSHYFATGVSGRPISGENIGRTLVNKNLTSSIQGHSHVLDYSMRTTATGERMHGMSIGCYTHPDMIEGWNRNTQHMWWTGVVYMNTADDTGDLLTMSTIKQEVLKELYA